MSFLEIAKKRYSVRKFTSQQVEMEKLQLILEAGRVAPTGANRQPQNIIVVQSPEGLAKISKAANIFNAPLALIVCADEEQVWIRGYDSKKITDIDATIVTDHMMLEATDLGLGSVWVCSFNPDVLRDEFSLTSNINPINILVIGYADCPAQSPERHEETRKPISQTVFYEKI